MNHQTKDLEHDLITMTAEGQTSTMQESPQSANPGQPYRGMKRSKTIALGITLASALAFTGGCADDTANRGQVERLEDSQGDYRAGASAGWGDSAGASGPTSGSHGYRGGTSHYWFHNNGYTGGTSSGIRPYAPTPPRYTAPISRGIFGGTARSFSSGGMS